MHGFISPVLTTCPAHLVLFDLRIFSVFKPSSCFLPLRLKHFTTCLPQKSLIYGALFVNVILKFLDPEIFLLSHAFEGKKILIFLSVSFMTRYRPIATVDKSQHFDKISGLFDYLYLNKRLTRGKQQINKQLSPSDLWK